MIVEVVMSMVVEIIPVYGLLVEVGRDDEQNGRVHRSQFIPVVYN